MDEHAFVQTLEHVLTPDTNVVKQATAKLRQDYFTNPQSLPLLVQVVRNHANPNLKQLAAVEARSLVPKFWGKDNAPSQIPDDVKSQIRESLLQSATQDQSSVVRHSAARVIAVIAKIDLPQGAWLDLPNIMSRAAASDKVDEREVGIYLLYTLLETLADVVADRWREFLQLFSQTVLDVQSMTVRVNTLLALGRMAEVINTDETPEAVGMFQELLPHMVNVLKQISETGDDENANPAFEVFQTLLMVDSALIAAHLADLIGFFSDLSVNKNLSDDIRSKALSFLISCLRYKKMKVQALRVGETLTLRAMELVTEFKDSEDPDDMTPSRTALQLLDYMAAALPPSQVVVPLLNRLPQYISHQDPAFRRAGILALGYCVEGAPDFVATQLNSIFPIVLTLLNDPVQTVQQGALHCVTRLADDLAEELGKEHARLLPLLIHILETGDSPEMWCRACNAIDAVLVGVEQSDVETYLPTLMPKLSTMFSQEDFKLKAAAVGGIGSAALSSKESFAPYFESVMNALSPYVTIKDSEEELDLRGIVLDCMGSVAEAVGMKAFTPYVQPLMQSAEESLNLGHPRLRETAFMFFATVAKLYGEEFAPFLPLATQALFQSLGQDESDEDEIDPELVSKIVSVGATGTGKAPVSGAVVEMNDDSDDDNDELWEELSIVNAISLEKEAAAETIGEILSNCKHAFLPYLEKTVTVLAEKCGHPYEGVRKASISTLWRAYAALWQVSEERGMEKWQKGLPLKVQPTAELKKLGEVVVICTLECMKTEGDRQTVKDILLNIGETLKLCGPAFLADATGDLMLELTTEIVLVLQKNHPCQMDEYEEEAPELQESAEYDWLVIDAAMDCCLGLAEALGEQYSEVWKVASKHMIKYASSSDPRERSTAVGVVAESIKHMGVAATPHTEMIFKLLLHRLSDEDPDTKANATYALGQLAINTNQKHKILSSLAAIIAKLEPTVNAPAAEVNHRLADNTAGCIARLIMAFPEQVPLNDLLNGLANLLPLKEDYEENEPVFDCLVKLYQSGNQDVFQLTQRFMPALSHVLAPPEEQLQAATRERVVELVKFIGSKDANIVQGYQNLRELY